MKKLLTMVLVLSIIGMVTGCESSSETSSDDSYGDLQYIAESYVTEQLGSPSTAKFESKLYEECVTELGTDRYKYIGTVNAENAFGGTKTINFTIIARHEGGDKWVVESFDYTEY